MNDNAKKWVAALRSGEFKQTKGFLKDGVGHCCLGVACEVYQREVGGSEWKRHPAGNFSFDGRYGYLPTTVWRWLGLQSRAGDFNEDDYNGTIALAERNDEGATFSEIADLIESEPEGLFVHSAKPDEMNPSEVSS